MHQERAIRATLSDKVSDVESTIEELATRFLNITRSNSRQEVLASPSPIPMTGGGGVYGWWFNLPPAVMNTSGCYERDGYRLLSTGISPPGPRRMDAGSSTGTEDPSARVITERDMTFTRGAVAA